MAKAFLMDANDGARMPRRGCFAGYTAAVRFRFRIAVGWAGSANRCRRRKRGAGSRG